MLRELMELIGKFFSWLFSRPTLRVRIQEDDPEKEIGGLAFEVENISDKITSLDPLVTENYVSVKRKRMRIAFDVREAERGLAPFTSKQFSASARERQSGRGHAWFRIYTFVPTRGRTRRVRIRNAYLQPVGFFRFWMEQLWFLCTGRLIGETSSTMDDYRARKRSRGPH